MMLGTVILYLLTILVSGISYILNILTHVILVSVQDIVTVTSTVNSIIFTFNTTIDGTTRVTVTLSPNVIEEGSIGGGVMISGLMPNTLYTYTVSFVYNNIAYSLQSSVTTPTTTTSTSGIWTSSKGKSENIYNGASTL